MNSSSKLKVSSPKVEVSNQPVRKAMHKLLFVFEAGALGFLALCLLGFIKPDNPAFLGISPHPYLLLACLLGALRGLRVAALVSPVIAAVYLYFLRNSVDLREVESVFTLDRMALPFAILGLPSIFGAISDGWKRKVTQLQSQLQEKIKLIAELESINEIITKEKKVIEGRISSQSQTIPRAFEYARVLETTDSGEICSALVDFVCDEIREDNCYAYLLENGKLVRKAYKDKLADGLPSEISQKDLSQFPVIRHALEGRTLSKEGQGAEAYSKMENRLAAPLTSSTDEMMGVLVTRSLRFLNYISPTFATFDALAKWGGMALGRASRLNQIRDHAYRDDVTGLLNHAYFQKRLSLDFHLAQAYQLPLYLVRFDLQGLRHLSTGARVSALKLFAKTLERNCHKTDHLSLGRDEGSFYTVMLAQSLELERYKQAIEKEFTELKARFQPAASLELKCYKAGMGENQKDLSQLLSSEKPW